MFAEGSEFGRYRIPFRSARVVWARSLRPTTTLDVYVHLFPDDDASEDMAALGAMGQAKPEGNVVALRR